MITDPETQEQLYEQVVRDAQAVSHAVRDVAAALTADELSWHPPDKGWSVAQIFEHLCVSHDSYLGRIEALLSRDDLPLRGESPTPWSPKIAGAFLVRSLRAPRKLPAPRLYRVGAQPRDDAIGAFLERQDQLAALIERAAPYKWSACRLGSPVASIFRFNLGDAFLILVTHAQRHLGQVARVRQHMARTVAG